jgi:phage terminase large subunit
LSEKGWGEAEFPSKLKPLFEPKRYKVLYGGRGGAKSWGIARALLIQGANQPLRILCCREVQKSIQDSVYQLLIDQIQELGLSGFYTSTQSEIRGVNGTKFIFAGLQHNIDSIKSKEGVDRAWCEEAQTLSKTSLDKLIPTIRKENSELWFSFNPELEEDEVYKRFVLSPPATAWVEKIGWQDNPWFPEVLRLEKDDLYARDTDAYLNVWEGQCRQALEGAIYAKELREAANGGRITHVPYDPLKPVDIFCDLGWSDCTSLWFAQRVAFEYRILESYQNAQQPWNHYLAAIQGRGYVLGTIFLPHDARAKSLATGRTIHEITMAAGFKTEICPNIAVEDGINALRTIFKDCWFDQVKCSDGLQALRRYRYDVDPDTKQFSRKPLHDESSHFADALRYMAVAMRDGKVKKPTLPKMPATAGSAWMAR